MRGTQTAKRTHSMAAVTPRPTSANGGGIATPEAMPSASTAAAQPLATQPPRETVKLRAARMPAVDVEQRGPVFVLAVPRSFSSVVSTMIGQHPQLYGFPELSLFENPNLAEWWHLCKKVTFPRSHGLIRVIAELVYGGQTEANIGKATAWLLRRAHYTTGYLFELLAESVAPRIPVEKSPAHVWSVEFMRRIGRLFPNARFVHLVRHPRGQGKSVLKLLTERRHEGPMPPNHWMFKLTSAAAVDRGPQPVNWRSATPDPQYKWLELNSNIARFLKEVPPSRQIRIRGEDILGDPDTHLAELCRWLGVDASPTAIEEMKHPERSVYSRFGPAGARFGNDLRFLENPALRSGQAGTHLLEGISGDATVLTSEVKSLARQFGYL